MHWLNRLRTPTGWLRALLVGLVLAFGFGTIAHAAHRHDALGSASVAHGGTCGYCFTFGATAAPPAHRPPSFAVTPEPYRLSWDDAPSLPSAFLTSARSRAPPAA
jgi:hypothetical protein